MGILWFEMFTLSMPAHPILAVQTHFIRQDRETIWTSVLINSWASHLSAGKDVSGQFHFGKVALADGFEQPVVADVRLLGAAGSNAGPSRARADLLTPITVWSVLWKQKKDRV